MVDLWIAVGALRKSLVRRWDETMGERPRSVNLLIPSGSGALDGAAGASGSESGLDATVTDEGLYEKSEETTSLEVAFGRGLV